MANDPTDRRRYRLLLFGAVVFFAFAAFALLVPMPVRGRLWDQLFDLLHIPAFASINVLALMIASHHGASRWRMPIVITTVVVLTGGAVEVLQGMTHRKASAHDFFANAMGAIAALMLFQVVRLGRESTIRFGKAAAMMLVAAACVTVAIADPAAAILDVYRQSKQFPQLAAFQSRAELQRWHVGSATVRRARSDWHAGASSLRVRFIPAQWPAIQLQQLQRDWTGYETLVADLYHRDDSESATVTVQIRIADPSYRDEPDSSVYDSIQLKRGQIARWRVALRQGDSSVDTPPLDLRSIRFVELMAVQLKSPATVEIGPIRLE
jgi:VanZ family protein